VVTVPELSALGNVKPTSDGGAVRLDADPTIVWTRADLPVATSTFTPTLGGSPDPSSVTYGSGNAGLYVRVGKLVWFNLLLSVTAYVGGGGGLRIRGLPFVGDPAAPLTTLPVRINGPVNWAGGSSPAYASARLLGDALSIDRNVNNASLLEVQLSAAAPSGAWQIAVSGAYVLP